MESFYLVAPRIHRDALTGVWVAEETGLHVFSQGATCGEAREAICSTVRLVLKHYGIRAAVLHRWVA